MPRNKMIQPAKKLFEQTTYDLFVHVCHSIITLYGFKGFSRILRKFIESYNNNLFDYES